jgi:4-hydroxy-3-methylbut-2-enyl diphosphate reductase
MKVSETIHDAVVARYGQASAEHFQELDTICSATQERQDSVDALARASDVIIVVGGYNSSNTTNLNKVAHQYTTAFHVEGPGHLARQWIRHQPYGRKVEETTENWLPDKPEVRIGITSGASTPDSVLEEVLHEVLALDGE